MKLRTVPCHRIIGLMLATLLCLSLFSAGAAADTPTVTGYADYDAAYEVFTLVNRERAAQGLAPLVMDAALLETAMLRAAELSIVRDTTRPDGTKSFTAYPDYEYQRRSESIAWGQKDPEAVMSAWMGSESNRQRILSENFNIIGVGCVIVDGKNYWTQCFMQVSNPPLTDCAEPASGSRTFLTGSTVAVPTPTPAPSTVPTPVPTAVPTPSPTPVPTSAPTPGPTTAPGPDGAWNEMDAVRVLQYGVGLIGRPAADANRDGDVTPADAALILSGLGGGQTPSVTPVPANTPAPTPVPTPVPTLVPTAAPTPVPADSGTVSGVIQDALTGRGTDGVTLCIRQGWNNTGGTVLSTINAGRDGSYAASLPAGQYTVEASKTGYIPISFNITVTAGGQDFRYDVIAPREEDRGDDSVIRIVLTWGSEPLDLDAHAMIFPPNGGAYDVYWGEKECYINGKLVCGLDVDDMTGYGPETITLHPQKDVVLSYYVDQWSLEGTLASSGAQVKVYKGSSLYASFDVPADLSGERWNLFSIVNGQIIVPQEDYRIVLTWDDQSQDLHAYTYGYDSDGGLFEVFYYSGCQEFYENGELVCKWKEISQNGVKSEAVTLNPKNERPCYYFVKLSGGAIENTGARVEIFSGDTLLGSYGVPKGQGSGPIWNLFAIKNGQLIVKNEVVAQQSVSTLINYAE